MPKFGAQIDTQLIPIKGMRPEQSTVFPASPVEGQMIHRTDQNKVYQYLAGAWQQIAPAGAPLTHTHLWADITDKPTTFTPSAHAHAATEINYEGSAIAGYGAATVEAALDTLASGVDSASSQISAHVSDTSDAHAATAISYAGSTDLSSTNVEAALDELDTEKAPKANPTFTGTVSGITKAMVGLGNVDNTSDLNKPISTATQTALNGKVNLDGDENISGVKSFLSSPIVPAPTDSVHAASKAYVDSIVAAQDAMVFKGVIDASANPNYPAANRGDTYRISVAGKIGGASGKNVEVGDLLIALTDGTAAGTDATVGANWTIVQANLDGAVIGPATSSNETIPIFDGTSGKLLKDSAVRIWPSSSGVLQTGDGSVPTSKVVSDALATKSSTSHTHAFTDITGTLAVNKGGTGATDAATARTNLGVLSDQAAATASMRTLGTGATQAAAGNHSHAFTAITGTAALTQGGTGATTAAAARTNLVAAGAYSANLAALVAGVWSANLAHNLNSQFIDVTINEVSTGENVILDWKTIDANNVQIRADIAYAANALRVLVTSK